MQQNSTVVFVNLKQCRAVPAVHMQMFSFTAPDLLSVGSSSSLFFFFFEMVYVLMQRDDTPAPLRILL